jgi:small subunit ribosomal protein S6
VTTPPSKGLVVELYLIYFGLAQSFVVQNQYETVFILTPVLSEVQIQETVEKIKQVLIDNGAELMNEEHWGLRKLAYPIQHKSTGYYQLFQFKATPELLTALDIAYKREERLLRFLTVKLDKYAVAYADRRMKKVKNKKEEAPAE